MVLYDSAIRTKEVFLDQIEQIKNTDGFDHIHCVNVTSDNRNISFIYAKNINDKTYYVRCMAPILKCQSKNIPKWCEDANVPYNNTPFVSKERKKRHGNN